MLININLLPKKPPKNMANYLTFFVILIVIAAGLVFIYFQSISLRSNIASLMMDTNAAHVERVTIERELTEITAQNTALAEQQLLIGVLNETIYTTTVFDEVTSLLPVGASIRDYTYTNGESITFRILAQTYRDVGVYVENLNVLSWVSEASFQSAEQQDEEGFLGDVTVSLDREGLLTLTREARS